MVVSCIDFCFDSKNQQVILLYVGCQNACAGFLACYKSPIVLKVLDSGLSAAGGENALTPSDLTLDGNF